MTDSSIIEDARDVLAKWCGGATPGPWSKRGIGYVFSDHESPLTKEIGYTGTPVVDTFMWPEGGEFNLALIVGTAGNPELWEALDGLLRHHAEDGITVSAIATWVRLIAAAIIAADERMSA